MNFTSSSGGCWLFGKPYQWLEGVDGQLELKPDVVQHTLFPLETKRRFDRYMGRREKVQQLYRAYNSPEARMMTRALVALCQQSARPLSIQEWARIKRPQMTVTGRSYSKPPFQF